MGGEGTRNNPREVHPFLEKDRGFGCVDDVDSHVITGLERGFHGEQKTRGDP